MRLAWWAWIWASALLVAGCASGGEHVIEPAPPTFDGPLVDPLPLRVAYAFDPNVDEEVVFRQGRSDRPIATYRMHLGPVTRASFERVLKAIFSSAVQIDASSAAAEPARVDGLVRVRLKSAFTDANSARVIYELEFLGVDGSTTENWEVSGSGSGAEPVGNVERSVRAVAAQVARELPQREPVQAWLRSAAPAPRGAT